MQGRLVGQRGPLAIVPPGLSRDVADWEGRAGTALARRPELLSQFRAATGPASPFSTMVGPAGKLHDQMGQRIQVLKAILRSLQA